MKSAFLIFLLSLFYLSCSAPSGDTDGNTGTNTESTPGNAIDVTPLLIGESIPDITLRNHQNESVNLQDISSENSLFVFYRGGWCPFCSAELAELSSY